MSEQNGKLQDALNLQRAELAWTEERIQQLQDYAGSLKQVIEALSPIVEGRTIEQKTAGIISGASDVCGCGRKAKHAGRCWFRRGYKSATESHALPHRHKERDKAQDKEQAAESETKEMIDVGALVGQTVKDREQSVVLADAAEEAARPSVEASKRTAQQRRQQNTERHNEIKEFQLRARGICPKCKGPMGHSPYANCHGCMGSQSQKIEARTFSKSPSNLSGNGSQGNSTPSLA